MPDVAGTLGNAGMRKAVDVSTSMLVTKSYADLELRISYRV